MMRCYICDNTKNWHSLQELNKERELLVCKGCGNVCYRVEEDQAERMKEFYRKEYRPAPSWLNLMTTSRKLNYILIFLGDFLKGKKGLVCGDVGCATGYWPAHLRKLGHRATGSEYTVTFRRFAEHFYGIPIQEELPTKHKYDLISLYHTLEHMPEPDKVLARYRDMLKEDGRILVSCPQWLDTLEEASGSAITSFEHLFHKDHINVFTENSLKALFEKCGLEIEKEDHLTYGQTYLLKRDDVPSRPTEDPDAIVAKIRTHKKAIDLHLLGKYVEALEVEPKFPECWVKLILETNQKLPEVQAEQWKEAQKACGENLRLRQALGVWLYQQEKFEEAIALFQDLLDKRPNEDVFMFMGWSCSNLAALLDGKDDNKARALRQLAIRSVSQSAELSPLKWQEAMNWACNIASKIPCWEERATEEVKEQMFRHNRDKVKLAPRDKVMDDDEAGKPAAKPEKEGAAELQAPAKV